MNAILLSTLLGPNASKQAEAEDIRLNPASQNFYYRLAESLRYQFELLCASSSPVYAEDEGFLYELDKLEAYIFKHQVRVLFFDSLSIHLSRLALSLRAKTGIRLIAICTDDPSNISNTKFYYPILCKHYARKANAYFCLTPGLNNKFNRKKKPVLYQLGILEEGHPEPKKLDRPYVYFGGALYQRYGIMDMVEAFEELHPNVDLIIAGHGPLDVVLKQKNGKSLQFLGKISREEHLSYIAGAVATINPRRYDPKLDPMSVPSKVLEYLAYSKCVISTHSTPIKEHYGKLVNWIGQGDNKAAVVAFLKTHLNEVGDLIDLITNKDGDAIHESLCSRATGKRLYDFVNQLS